MSEIINALTFIGFLTVGAIASVVLYVLIGVGFILLETALDRLQHRAFYVFGGEADEDTWHYRPPRPPLDVVYYSFNVARYYVQKVGNEWGVMNVTFEPKGMDKVYEQREEYYGDDL